jgi:hypothetical protein
MRMLGILKAMIGMGELRKLGVLARQLPELLVVGLRDALIPHEVGHLAEGGTKS